MSIRVALLFASSVVALSVASLTEGAEVTVAPSDHGAMVKIDGAIFTEYWTQSGTKPVLWPVIGPTGKPMTRAYPLGKAPNEKQDHIHHRSIWFTHGSINGVSFWEESPKAGKTVHRKFVEMKGGSTGLLVTENDWIGPDGKKVLEDQRRITFGCDGVNRWIDFDIALKASEVALKFGDTKEGSFGVRVAESIKVEAKKANPKLGGRIVNSEGQVDDKAWGKQAAWVDYSGPVDDQTVGVAILNHPSSFRYPTYWHVRTYGLFAANPFGIHDFTAGKGEGSYTLPRGETLRLRYRVLLHPGDVKAGKVAEAAANYAKSENRD